MRGSGSLDYSVDAAFVPAERTIQPGVTRPVVDTPLARFPNFALLAAGVSAVGLGIARRALDELIDLAQGKKPQYSSRTLAQSGFTQVEVARADAHLRSARAFLLEQLADTWRTVRRGDEASLDARIGIRSAAVHAATVAAAVTDTAFTLAGGTAVYDTSRARTGAARRARRHPAHPDRAEAERDDRQTPARRRRRHRTVLRPPILVCVRISATRSAEIATQTWESVRSAGWRRSRSSATATCSTW